jgi:hypothetical protein
MIPPCQLGRLVAAALDQGVIMQGEHPVTARLKELRDTRIYHFLQIPESCHLSEALWDLRLLASAIVPNRRSFGFATLRMTAPDSAEN